MQPFFRIYLVIIICLIFVKVSLSYSECSAVHNNSRATNHNRNTKWAIISLSYSLTFPLHVLRDRLIARILSEYASSNRSITIITFSEKTFPQTEMDEFSKIYANITGVSVKFIDTSEVGFNNNKHRYGYKYMCRFFAIEMLHYLKDYDFYWRIDTDIFITRMPYNIFQWVEQNNLEHAYAHTYVEYERHTVATMMDWVHEYTVNCSTSVRMTDADQFGNLSIPLHFQTAMTIGSISFFLRPDVYHFLDAVNQSGFILSHRWGDSPIQAYAIRLFMNVSRNRLIPGIVFAHTSHRTKVMSGSQRIIKGSLGMVEKVAYSALDEVVRVVDSFGSW